jgi:hypothetical protein
MIYRETAPKTECSESERENVRWVRHARGAPSKRELFGFRKVVADLSGDGYCHASSPALVVLAKNFLTTIRHDTAGG